MDQGGRNILNKCPLAGTGRKIKFPSEGVETIVIDRDVTGFHTCLRDCKGSLRKEQ